MQVKVEIEANPGEADVLRRMPRARQIARMFDLLRRFVHDDDAKLSDFEFATALYNRVRADRGVPLIDPNE